MDCVSLILHTYIHSYVDSVFWCWPPHYRLLGRFVVRIMHGEPLWQQQKRQANSARKT